MALDKEAAQLHRCVLGLCLGLCFSIVILCDRTDYVVGAPALWAYLISALWGFIVQPTKCNNLHSVVFSYYY